MSTKFSDGARAGPGGWAFAAGAGALTTPPTGLHISTATADIEMAAERLDSEVAQYPPQHFFGCIALVLRCFVGGRW